MKIMLPIAAVAVAAAAPAVAQPVGPAPQFAPGRFAQVQTRAEVAGRVAQHFARVDLNRDGFITQAEAQALRGQHAGQRRAQAGQRMQRRDPAQRFARMDANHDGVISRPEFDAAHQNMRNGMRRAFANRAGFGGRMFATADLNRDGRVSLPEAQQAALQHFDRADLNRDGTLTPQERQQARQLLRAQRRG